MYDFVVVVITCKVKKKKVFFEHTEIIFIVGRTFGNSMLVYVVYNDTYVIHFALQNINLVQCTESILFLGYITIKNDLNKVVLFFLIVYQRFANVIKVNC